MMELNIDINSLARDLVQYSVVNSPDYKPSELNNELTMMQEEYIKGIIDGKKPSDICRELCVSRVQPSLWRKQNKLFADAIELVENLRADELESAMWEDALKDGANPIKQMFLLKAFKDKYRENAQAPTANTVNLVVSVGKEEFKVVVDTTPEIED